jgi:hypothetical protein
LPTQQTAGEIRQSLFSEVAELQQQIKREFEAICFSQKINDSFERKK